MGAAYRVRRGKVRLWVGGLWAVLKIDSSGYSLGGHNLGAYSHFADKRETAPLSAGSPDFVEPALDKQVASALGWVDCSTLDGVARVSAQKDCWILPHQMSPRLILNGRKTVVQIAVEQANRNQALAPQPAPVGVTAHNPAAVSETLLAFGHYIGVEAEAENAAERALESARARQMS